MDNTATFRRKLGLMPHNVYINRRSKWSNPCQMLMILKSRNNAKPINSEDVFSQTGRTTELLISALHLLDLGKHVYLLSPKGETETRLLQTTLEDYASICDLDTTFIVRDPSYLPHNVKYTTLVDHP
jgi:hypothetical protein